MSKDTLQEFFRAKKQKSQKAAEGIDWAKKKKAWLRAVDQLYRLITKEYLGKVISDRSITIGYSPETIIEDYIGEYEVYDLVLQVGDEKVVFSPKGTNIVGASGRVDMRGEMGEVTMVLQPGARWSVVISRSPTLKVVPLDKRSLLDALKTVMRP